MSNSTQNDCNCVMSGYAQTTNGCPVHKYSTQNETLGIPEWDENMQEAYDRGYRKGRADARKEVMGKVEGMKTDKILKSYWSDSITSSSHAGGYLQAIDDVLATLREEEP